MRKLVLLAVVLSFPALAYDINVKDHGAVGNGTANDAPAIQAALNAGALLPSSEAVVVYFPRGTYLLGDTLHIPSGHRYILRGAGYAPTRASPATGSTAFTMPPSSPSGPTSAACITRTSPTTASSSEATAFASSAITTTSFRAMLLQPSHGRHRAAEGRFVQIQNNHFDLIGRGVAMSSVPPEAAAILVKYSGSAPKIRELLISGNQFNQNGHDTTR